MPLGQGGRQRKLVTRLFSRRRREGSITANVLPRHFHGERRRVRRQHGAVSGYDPIQIGLVARDSPVDELIDIGAHGADADQLPLLLERSMSKRVSSVERSVHATFTAVVVTESKRR